jgi:transketolase
VGGGRVRRAPPARKRVRDRRRERTAGARVHARRPGENVAERFAAFGWDARTVDGHDVDAIARAVDAAAHDERPHVLVARTVFGRGVSYMESRIKWHYWPMSADEFEQAMREVAAS